MSKIRSTPPKVASLVIAAVCLPAPAMADPASLSLLQGLSSEQIARIPVCSANVKTNCRKAGLNGTWILVGLAAVGGLVAMAAGGAGQGKAPTPPAPPSPVSP
jgi:hypothetical protein